MDTNLNPVVTVLVAAFNAENYISETIQSVLSQTFKNFELLIVDDGSTDSTHVRILEFSDDRIHVLRNKKNEGLISSLNRGILHSKAKYIARLDADDIAFPTRLEKQVAFMEANLEVGLCGTFAEVFGAETGIMKVPTEHDEISAELCILNRFIHPSVIMRRSVLSQHRLLYRLPFAEDYDLWCRMSLVTQVRNIPEVLVRYRKHEEQVTNRSFLKVQEATDKVIISHLNTLFAGILNTNELKLLLTIIHVAAVPQYAIILGVVDKLNLHNDNRGTHDKVSLLKVLEKKIILHQMRATKKYRFNDFILIVRAHFRLLYEILGYRYGTKLLFCTLIAKRRK